MFLGSSEIDIVWRTTASSTQVGSRAFFYSLPTSQLNLNNGSAIEESPILSLGPTRPEEAI